MNIALILIGLLSLVSAVFGTALGSAGLQCYQGTTYKTDKQNNWKFMIVALTSQIVMILCASGAIAVGSR